MKDKNKLSFLRVHKSLKVFIEDILHLEVRMDKYLGLQSWLDGGGSSMYYIEICMDGGNILLEYDDKELWKGVLSLLNSKL